MASSWTVARVWGIPIELHWTFLLVLPLFAYLMGTQYFAGPGGATTTDYLWGGALAIALFVSVVFHELGHSYVAQRYGVPIKGIMLLPIGGVSQMERMPEEPGQELRVAIAGPLVSFALGIPILAAALLGVVPPSLGTLHTFVYFLGLLNVVLGAFNLFLPAFPMDGGRILRAGLAKRMGLRDATRWAALVGRALAFAMGIFGFFTGNWLFLLVAFFVYLGASQEERQVQATTILGDLTAAQVMTREVRAVKPEATVAEVYQEMIASKHITFPVEANGNVVGIVSLHDLGGVSPHLHEVTLVREVMRSDVPRVPPDTPARDLLNQLSQAEDDRLVVVQDEAGGVAGIVTRTDLMRLIQILDSEGSDRSSGPRAPPQQPKEGPQVEWVDEEHRSS